MKQEVLDELLAAIDAHRATVLALRMPSGDHALLFPLDPPEPGNSDTEAGMAGSWPMDDARQALLEDRAVTLSGGAETIFLRPYNPPVRLVVVGAAHIAAPLAEMARTTGIHTTIVDPRSAFASEERFPEVTLVRAWPAEALASLDLDHRTAVVTLTHDEKLDDPALLAALASDAFYIGALGSSRTHAKRLTRLSEEGVRQEGLERIRGPVGLDIGARSPAEIAVAILAQLIDHLRRPEAR